MREIDSVCIVGLGYIGLPTSIMFAQSGFQVLGVDIEEDRITSLNSGKLPFEETDLEERFSLVYRSSLSFGLQPSESDVFIIAVPTPIHTDYTADLSCLVAAIDSILPWLRKGNLVIIESTIPPTTTDGLVAEKLRGTGWNPGVDIYLAHCPERVLPGKIVHEIIYNPRIIGGINESSSEKAAALYKSFVKGTIIQTSALNAEMTKLMENTYRDVNIALANELVKISSILPINPLEVIRFANYHPRVNLLQPGPGVGGHCIAVDPYFIIEKAFQQTPLLQTARSINNSMPDFVVQQILRLIEGVESPVVSVYGITYKGNVGDTRESPALEILHMLKQYDITVKIYDPYVTHNLDFPLEDEDESLRGSDLLVVLSDHTEFGSLDEHKLIELMRRAVVFDTKNCVRIFSPEIGLINFNNMFHD